MSIQIIDNFNISVSKPIDDRFVVGPQSFYTDKNDIPYKYIGLRVWDLNDGVPYVWDGATWTSENSVSVSGSGSASYVPKFIGSGNSTVLGNSCIYVSGTRVGINNTSITTGYNLDVIGGVISQGATGFSGVGTLLTNLNASNITTGTMSLARLSNYTSSGWILTSGASQPLYTNPYSITVGAASLIQITNDTTTATPIQYITFVGGFSSAQYSTKVSGVNSTESASTKQLTYRPSTGQLTSTLMATRTLSAKYINSVTSIDFDTYAGITYSSLPALILTTNNGANRVFVEAAHVNFGLRSTGTPRISLSASPTAALPSYTWYDDLNTGMYRPSADVIGFSTGGIERMSLSNNGISIVSSTYSNWSVGSISADCWLINLTGNTQVSAFDLPSTTYDRIIYGWCSGDFQINLYAEVTPSTTPATFFILNRSAGAGYGGTMMILPAGRKWRCNLDVNTGSGWSANFSIYRFGR
jgi:hypothetical protein